MSSLGNQKIIKAQKRLVVRHKSPKRNYQNKFEELYQNYKTRKAKNELLKQRILSEREQKDLTECTFTPKITKLKNIFIKKPVKLTLKEEALKNQKANKIQLESHLTDLINRQNEWLENKKNRLNRRIVAETMKNLEKCVFEPKIQKPNKKTIYNLRSEARKIIEKPDSYLNFITKNREFRKNKSNSKFYEYPISKGLVSPRKFRLLKLNKINDYDYTKHQLTERSLIFKNQSKSNLNNNLSISLSNKSFHIKKKEPRKTSVPSSKLKINNITDDELYKMVSLKEKEKINKEMKEHTDENMDSLFQGKDKVNFKEAMDRLHYALVNLKLDNENEKAKINANENGNVKKKENIVKKIDNEN